MRLLKVIAFAALALSSNAAAGQLLVNGAPPLTPEAAQRIADIENKIPVPADTVPPTEMVGGAAGATNTFRRGDAAAPRRSARKDRRRAVRIAWEKLVRWSRSWRRRNRSDVLETTRKVGRDASLASLRLQDLI